MRHMNSRQIITKLITYATLLNTPSRFFDLNPTHMNTYHSPTQPSVQLHTIQEEDAGQRIDNFLLRICKGVPKSWVYRVVRKGEVRVNKGRIDVSYKLIQGDVVRIPPVRMSERTASTVPSHKANTLPIIYEDDALLVIDKPAGLAVHGGSGVSYGVIEQLRAAYPKLKFLELVHRLDKETSGLLILAKKRAALVHLHEQIRNGQMDKRYYTLVKGNVADTVTHIKAPLHKYVAANGERRVVIANPNEGQSAHTQLNIEQKLSGYTALRVRIFTGRTHQIRVHCASLNHPIVGDEKYGDFELNKQLAKSTGARMFLHAHLLRLTHPISQQPLALEAPIPQAFTQFIQTHAL